MPFWYQALLRPRVLKLLPSACSRQAPLSIVMEDREAGFFSNFFQVLGAIDLFGPRRYDLALDYRHAPFVDRERGEDWWSYYFDPNRFRFGPPGSAVQELSRPEDLQLISRYGGRLPPVVAHRHLGHIRLQPNVAGRVADYVERNFRGGRIIGVHYRGTDKVDSTGKEAGRVPYNYVVDQMAEAGSDAMFFIATDEVAFVDAVQDRFPTRVLCLDAIRSTDGKPVHFTAGVRGMGYRAGEEALIDSLLLSRCALLLRTDSNLSHACSFFNPHQQTVNLTKKYWDEQIRFGMPVSHQILDG